MNMYMHVGTDEIGSDLFVSIKDSESYNRVKPRGGVWATKFDVNAPNHNPWISHVLYDNPGPFYHKYNFYDKIPCSLLKIKDDARIFKLKSKEGIKFLLDSFSDGQGGISFEKLSSIYDGIDVKLNKFIHGIKDEQLRSEFEKYGIDSLVLFNTNVIDYYYSGDLNVFNYDPSNEEVMESLFYTIKWDETRKYVDGSNSRKR